jgi:hypothetical protein
LQYQCHVILLARGRRRRHAGRAVWRLKLGAKQVRPTSPQSQSRPLNTLRPDNGIASGTRSQACRHLG